VYVIVGGAKTVPQSSEAGSASSTLHSVESSPSMFRMPARAPDQKDWTPDDSSTSCEECRALFSLVSRQLQLHELLDASLPS